MQSDTAAVARQADRTGARLALVVMPWATLVAPSVQCGSLKAYVERAGHTAEVHYVNLALASLLGPGRYRRLGNLGGLRMAMLGEWLFTRAAFGSLARSASDYLDAFPGMRAELAEAGESQESLSDLHERVIPDFVEGLAGATNWSRYDVVGFTSVFAQQLPSIALARAIKQCAPTPLIVFGGAGVDGGMGHELLRTVEWVDVTVTGEGERPLASLLDHVADHSWPIAIPGVARRVDGQVVAEPPGPVPAMNELPTPDYSDYFMRLDDLGPDTILRGRRPWLPFESSRGCWWGERHKCTFCGMNGSGNGYRTKSPAKVVDEVVALSSRYRSLVLKATDNILDQRSIGELTERLAATGFDFEIFGEVKANQSKEQLASLARAGVTAIQPGIESLSTHVLKLMNKGTTQLINVRTLKWAQHYRQTATWSILTGFPGERPEDLTEQAALMPLLYHLAPPRTCAPIWLDRHSPYFTQEHESFHDVRPRAGYRLLYPLPDMDVNEIAAFFDYEASDVVSGEELTELRQAAADWQRARHRPTGAPVLSVFRAPGYRRIVDSRREEVRKHTLTDLLAAVHDSIMDTFHSADAIRSALVSAGLSTGLDDVHEALQVLMDDELVIEDGGHYFALALPVFART